MINLRTKKWQLPLFRFVVDVAFNNTYQIYRQSHLNPGEQRLDALDFRRAIVDVYYRLYRKSLLSTTSPLHYPYITQQTICSLTVCITGLPRAHSDGVAYHDVKEPRYIIAKYPMSVFMLNVLNLTL